MTTAMQLVQVLLPVYDNDQKPLPPELYSAVAQELTDQFGGLTAFTRAPAEGLWRNKEARTSRDEIVVYEVMVEEVDRQWWESYREGLEARFRQERVVVRAQEIQLL